MGAPVRKGLSGLFRTEHDTIQVKYTDQICGATNQGAAWESMLLIRNCGLARALLFPGRIKRDKGVWWMPWQQEAMKDVITCDKPWGAGNRP